MKKGDNVRERLKDSETKRKSGSKGRLTLRREG